MEARVWGMYRRPQSPVALRAPWDKTWMESNQSLPLYYMSSFTCVLTYMGLILRIKQEVRPQLLPQLG